VNRDEWTTLLHKAEDERWVEANETGTVLNFNDTPTGALILDALTEVTDPTRATLCDGRYETAAAETPAAGLVPADVVTLVEARDALLRLHERGDWMEVGWVPDPDEGLECHACGDWCDAPAKVDAFVAAARADIDVERLARALPDWMVEHATNEADLRRIVAGHIAAAYREAER